MYKPNCACKFTVSYCSFYGKKVDPEPGRCRRTDGKKWRCSKEAYPDSKYCERHMHRGRNRSRKPVESQTMAQSTSTVTSLTVAGGSSRAGNFQNIPTTNAFGSVQNTTGSGTDRADYHLDTIPYGIPSKEYRYWNPYYVYHFTLVDCFKLENTFNQREWNKIFIILFVILRSNFFIWICHSFFIPIIVQLSFCCVYNTMFITWISNFPQRFTSIRTTSLCKLLVTLLWVTFLQFSFQYWKGEL